MAPTGDMRCGARSRGDSGWKGSGTVPGMLALRDRQQQGHPQDECPSFGPRQLPLRTMTHIRYPRRLRSTHRDGQEAKTLLCFVTSHLEGTRGHKL